MNSGEMIEVKTPDGVSDAYLSYPKAAGTYPAVLFFMDAFGLRKNLFEMADKLAKQGYVVLAPNFLYRVKKSPIVDLSFPLQAKDMGAAVQAIMPLVRGHDPELTLKDAEYFFAALKSNSFVKPGPMGITGYCMGGSLALKVAAQYPAQISAVASFHAGNLATESADSPHLLLKKIKARVYIAHADHDASMPKEQIDRLDAEIKRLKAEGKVNLLAETYADALHGYTMADLPAFNESARERHWKNLFHLLSGASEA